MLDIWCEKTEVRFGDVDRSNRLTLGSIFSFFQEAAISHAEDLGVGMERIKEQSGQGWILSRLSLFVPRRPLFGEKIEIRSWPRRWEKLFALRDYEIRDASGGALVRGRACWLIIDIEKRKPLRIEPILSNLPPNEGINAFLSGPAALGQGENLGKKMERRALYSDIDYYGHANNARYIQWIQDVTDMEVLFAADQFRLDINYISEILPGETVELWVASLGVDSKAPGTLQSMYPEDYPARAGPGFFYEGRRPDAGQGNEGLNKITFRAELRTGINGKIS